MVTATLERLADGRPWSNDKGEFEVIELHFETRALIPMYFNDSDL